MSSLNNPESSVRKNINIKFNNAQKSDSFINEEIAPRKSHRKSRSRSSSKDSSRSRSRSPSDSSRSSSRSRSRSSVSRSRSSFYSSSQYSESPNKSPYKKSTNGSQTVLNGGNQGSQFNKKTVDWSFSLNFCGEATKDPTIYICDICRLPVINYGRLLPCKHIFCYQCAMDMNSSDSKQNCTKCRNAISSVELCPPGQLFVCANGGSKIRGGCRRAYKTSEDLQTHANQRHSGSFGTPQNSETQQLEAASVCLASIQVHQAVPAAVAAANLVPGALPPGILNPAQLSQNLFPTQARPGPVTGPNPFVSPMMAQAALFMQAQAAQPFMFRGNPANMFMGPPPLVFAPSATAPSQAGTSNQPQNS